MRIVEVKDSRTIRKFLDMAPGFYKNDQRYVRPLDQDIEQVFDRNRNRGFRNGDAIRWILEDQNGKPLGRIAAFVDEDYAEGMDQPTGGMGFFECVKDQKAANLLLDTARNWLQERGMEAMDGPINFGDKRAWWGMLVKGFHQPTYQMNYNPPYYVDLIEEYGFQVYYYQKVFQRNIQEPAPERAVEKYNALMKDPGYRFDYFRKNQLEKYSRDFQTIYNNAWGNHEGFHPLEYKTVLKGFKKAKQVLYEQLMFFGYYKEEPIAFFIMIPDLNPVIKGFDGKFRLWEKLKLKWHIWRQTYPVCFGQIFGVVPEHQGKGVEGGIVAAAGKIVHPNPKNTWNHMEMTWIGDFNPKMLSVAKNVGGEEYKDYATFRYLFDREKPFHRAPIIGVEAD